LRGLKLGVVDALVVVLVRLVDLVGLGWLHVVDGFVGLVDLERLVDLIGPRWLHVVDGSVVPVGLVRLVDLVVPGSPHVVDGPVGSGRPVGLAGLG